MSFKKFFTFNLHAILISTYVLFIAGCGGGGGSDQENPAPVKQSTSRELAQICAKESSHVAKSFVSSEYGDLTDEKNGLKPTCRKDTFGTKTFLR